MQIISLEAENIKRIKAIRIEPKEPVVDIGGKNEAGKSSVLDSIMFCLGGGGRIDDVPIRKGEKNARVTLNLGKYVVTRVFTPSGGHMEVASADGAIYKSPQTLLDGFLGDLTFSPLDFMKSKDQAGMILKVSQIPFLAEELSKVSGVECADFTDLDPFTIIKGVSGVVYDKRTGANREVTRCEGIFNGITIPEGKEDTQLVKVADLFAERQEMEKKKLQNDTERNKVVQLETRTILKGKLVREASQRLQQLRDAVKNAEFAVDKAEEEFTKATRDKAAQVEKNDALVDPDFTEIDQKLTEADSINAIAAEIAKKDDAELDLLAAQKEHQAIDEKFKAIKEYREDLLQKTSFPVQGLGFDEDGNVTFESIPLSQRGTSKQIRVGLDILAALNPELRVVLVKDANDLDSENIEIVKAWAAEKKFQVWMERVQDEPGKVAFFIEDGELKE